MTTAPGVERRESTVSLMGAAAFQAIEATGEGVVLLFRALRHTPAALGRVREILGQMLVCGVYSLPVALLVATFTGMVLALQTGIELAKWGQAEGVGTIVAASMCRELGPVWIGVILAARVGSAMAAELGTMRVSEEIDALEVMSIDPAKFLVMPRVIALTIMAPVLTAYADIVGILGGAVVANYQLNVTYGAYFRWAERSLTATDILSGMLIKAPVFALTIAVVGCTIGLRVKPSQGAAGVGSATRNSVVISLILLIVFDYVLTSIIRHIG